MKNRILIILIILPLLTSCECIITNTRIIPSYVCESENITPTATWNHEGDNGSFEVKNKFGEIVAAGEADDERCNFSRPLNLNDLFDGRYLKMYAEGKERENIYYLILSGTAKESEPFATQYDIDEEEKTAIDTITYPDGTTYVRGQTYIEYKVQSAWVELKDAWFSYPEKIRAVKIKVLSQAGLINPPKMVLTNPNGSQYDFAINAGSVYDIDPISTNGKWTLANRYGGSLFKYTRESFVLDTFKLILFLICEE